jgi:hypothetical protein
LSLSLHGQRVFDELSQLQGADSGTTEEKARSVAQNGVEDFPGRTPSGPA